MYDGGNNGGHMNVPRYLENEHDYNHHNSASLEVVESHNNNLNGNEDEYIPMHPQQQMMMNPNVLSDYSDLHHSAGGVVGQENMMTHVFMPNSYGMDPNQYQQAHMIPQHLQQGQVTQEQMIQAYQAQIPHHALYDQGIMMQHHQMIPLAMQQAQAQQQIHPIPQPQQAQLGRPPHNGSQQEDHLAPLQPARKKSKAQYPWLEVQGPACYSERQEAGNVDLSNVSKKYKSMRCLYCTKYNPVTPWATMRPRKYELSSLMDHANSIHHQKAEKAREEALALPAMVPSVVYPIHDESSTASTATAPGDLLSGGVGGGGGLPSQAAPVMTAQASTQSVPLPPPPQQQPQQTGGISSSSNITGKQNQQQQNAATAAAANTKTKKRNVMELVKTHATRGNLRPPWLHTEGGLIFSERQLNDPDRPAGLVRKYQLMLCTACAQYSPRSPWSTLKPRKFEARLLAEHEMSTHHQKTLAMTMHPASAAGGGAGAATSSEAGSPSPSVDHQQEQANQSQQGQSQSHGQSSHGQSQQHASVVNHISRQGQSHHQQHQSQHQNQHLGQGGNMQQSHGNGQGQNQGQGKSQTQGGHVSHSQPHFQHALLQQHQPHHQLHHQQGQQQHHQQGQLQHQALSVSVPGQHQRHQQTDASSSDMPLTPLSPSEMAAAGMINMEDDVDVDVDVGYEQYTMAAAAAAASRAGREGQQSHNSSSESYGSNLPAVPVHLDEDQLYSDHMVYNTMIPNLEIHEDLSLDPSEMHGGLHGGELDYDAAGNNLYGHQQQQYMHQHSQQQHSQQQHNSGGGGDLGQNNDNNNHSGGYNTDSNS